VTKADVNRFPGVCKRPDSNTYQFALRVPQRAHSAAQQVSLFGRLRSGLGLAAGAAVTSASL
jgi:hypothetical protein